MSFSLKRTRRKYYICRRENYYYVKQTFFLGGACTGSFVAGFPLNNPPSSSSSSSPPNRSTFFADDFVFVVSVLIHNTNISRWLQNIYFLKDYCVLMFGMYWERVHYSYWKMFLTWEVSKNLEHIFTCFVLAVIS